MEILITEYILPFAGALLLLAAVTLVSELPFFIVGFGKEAYSLKYKLVVFALINLITFSTVFTIWITVSYLFDAYPLDLPIVILLIAMQIAAILTEAFVYKKAFKTGTAKPLIFSVTANVISSAAVMFVIYMLEM